MRVLKDYGGVILGLLGLLTGGAALFVKMSGETQHTPIIERVTKVETRQDATDARLERIEKGVDNANAKADAILIELSKGRRQ